MNEYIDKLIQDDKLSLSVDKSKTFGFQLGNKWVGKDKVLISGPCSVESEEMILKFSIKLYFCLSISSFVILNNLE